MAARRRSDVRLAGKVALITGAAGGLAADWVRAFAAEGAHVVAADIKADAVASVAAGAGADVRAVAMDVTDEASARDGVAAAVSAFGRLDVLCNGAGVMHREDGPIGELSLDVWNRILAVNLTGSALVAKFAVAEMVRTGGGSIVNTSSALAIAGAARSHAYVAAKGGVLSLTRAMAAIYARDGIRVNAICPGVVDTPLNADLFADERARERARRWHLQRRFGAAADVTPLVVYLASDESAWMTGAALPIDGGATAT
jgi:NAD(P)-dependent dehydrogenase (short-subunit alcohol dehydrogenase family)